MSRDLHLYLEDIIDSGARIRSYIARMDFDQFVQDQKTQDAVIRQFMIVGEVVKRLPSELKRTGA